MILDAVSSKDWIIFGLSCGIFICIVIITALFYLLKKEKAKRSTPVLTIELDISAKAIFLRNDSISGAKNIKIQDFNFALNYNFKKNLSFAFNDVDFIKPQEKIRLIFSIYDGKYEVPPEELEGIIAHLSSDPFQMHLLYENLEGAKFLAIISKEKDVIVVEKILPMDKTVKSGF